MPALTKRKESTKFSQIGGGGVDKQEEVFLRNRKRGSAKRVIAIIKGGTWYFLRH